MPINQTTNLLPQYIQTIPNQRFLNSTLDLLVSDPAIRRFDGYIGRREIVNTQNIGNFLNEPSNIRSQYQLEPEFVFSKNGDAVHSAGFKDVVNAVAAKGGYTNAWNRLLTGNTYTLKPFLDLDKLINYYNYVWVPDPKMVDGAIVDNNTWIRTPVVISNSVSSSVTSYSLTRNDQGFNIKNYSDEIFNPEVYLERGTTYRFIITPDLNSSGNRVPKSVTQTGTENVMVSIPTSGLLFSNATAHGVTNAVLSVDNSIEYDLNTKPLTIEAWVQPDSILNTQTIVGEWDAANPTLCSWVLQLIDGVPTFSCMQSNTAFSLSSNAPLTQSWHHLAVTNYAGVLKLFVDGIMQAQVSWGAVRRSAAPLTVANDASMLSAFNGNIADVRISKVNRYYSNFAVPVVPLANDSSTVLMLHLSGVEGETSFYDDPVPALSRCWIQSQPGTTGIISSNPSLSSREILGVNNNGVLDGTLTFYVPTLEDEAYYRNLSITGDNTLDYVDLATNLKYEDINGKVYSTFDGIDGIKNIANKTLIFSDSQNTGWGTVTNEQKFGIWKILVVGGNITLSPVANIAGGYKVYVKNGLKNRNTFWYKTANTSVLLKLPLLTSDYAHLYIQDDQNINSVIRLSIVEKNYTALDVETDIIGKKYFTSTNGIELMNGMTVKFAAGTFPEKYVTPIPVDSTTLLNSVDYTNTQFFVADISKFTLNSIVQIEDEILSVAWIDSQAGIVSMNRGLTSTAKPHASGSIISLLEQPRFVVEGVGVGIVLIPEHQLNAVEGYANSLQTPDYITINRASRDGNPWSRSNRWYSKELMNTVIGYLRNQGIEVQQPDTIIQGVRPIIEFLPGLKLWDFGTEFLGSSTIVCTTGGNSHEHSLLPYGNFSDGDTVVFIRDSDPEIRKTLYRVRHIDTTGSGVSSTYDLVPIGTAVDGSCIVVSKAEMNIGLPVDTSKRGYNWYYSESSGSWQRSSQIKTSVQQYPLFDIVDSNLVSFGQTSLYTSTTFAGSTLFEYKTNASSVIDPVLGIRIAYTNIQNIGGISFSNTYETDSFLYEPDVNTAVSVEKLVNTGTACLIDPVTGQAGAYNPWQPVACNLELYQTLSVPGSNVIDIAAHLLSPNSAHKTRIFVDGIQVYYDLFKVRQLGDIVRVEIFGQTVSPNSTVTIKILSADPIAGAWYDVPTQYEINPFNSRPVSFTYSDLAQHALILTGNWENEISYNSVEDLPEIEYAAFGPGLLLLHEGFSALPTLALTEQQYDIDQAIKNAGQQYDLFKAKFLKACEMIEGVSNMLPRLAIEQAFIKLNANKIVTMPWYTSDMVPLNGISRQYTVVDDTQTRYNIGTLVKPIASAVSVLVYLSHNGVERQLVKGVEYDLYSKEYSVNITAQLNVGDIITISEFNNTDGCFVPATPTKIGLAPAYIPAIYDDNTLVTPASMIQGHDGSLTKSYGDYRDNLLLELEQRIYNNIKVNNELWSEVINRRVPTPGAFRQDLCPYTPEQHKEIEGKFFYEWTAENRVDWNHSVFVADNPFTYNYSATKDPFFNEYIPGYWRGIYRWFYDTDRPHTHPWEMLGFANKPLDWEMYYGPLPYTADNTVMWNDIEAGIYAGASNGLVKRPGLSTIIPVDYQGNLLSPADTPIGANASISNFKDNFQWGDGSPAETAWRRSSAYRFAELRKRILMNPQFMVGVLWNLDTYCPIITSDTENFKLNGTQVPSFDSVILHSVDKVDGSTARVHSILNYIIEYIRATGQDASIMRDRLNEVAVKLVYNMAGFADAENISIYASQNSPQTVGQSVKIPQENYKLLLSQSVAVGSVAYSGVIITQSTNGYTVTGYDRNFPYFMVLPPKSTGKTTSITVGSNSYVAYQEFENEPVLIPYNTEFFNKQTVIDFLLSYGQYLTSIGWIFDIVNSDERADWLSGAVQFIKWSVFRWGSQSTTNRISLVLNPGAGTLTYTPQTATLESLLNNGVVILDENQKAIEAFNLDVFRDTDATYINHQKAGGVISAVRANLVNWEHKLILDNKTVFNDLIYDPVVGSRQDYLRIVGQKSGKWNGTLNAPGFILGFSDVSEWQPNTDYLKGNIVKYKNANYIAVNDIIGAAQFQHTQFTLSKTIFENKLWPSIGTKAVELEHAYDLSYHNVIPDMITLRCNALGYAERNWLADLGIDLVNQTEFYRGWIAEKGSPNAIQKFATAGQTNLLADFTLAEEYAVKVGDYGATGRTGYVEVSLHNELPSSNHVLIEFTSGTGDSETLKVAGNDIYKNSSEWTPNFIPNLGVSNNNDVSYFATAGPVLPSEIYTKAKDIIPDYSVRLQNALTWTNKSAMLSAIDKVSLMRVIKAGLWQWIAIDDNLEKDNRYNVISWALSSAKIKQIRKGDLANTIDFYLDRPINVIKGDVFAIDLNDSRLVLQGVFRVTDYNNSAGSGYSSILTTTVVDSSVLSMTGITYIDENAPTAIYTYYSLRANDIGSANLSSVTNSLGVTTTNKIYVDYDTTGYAVYDFVEPFSSTITKASDTRDYLTQVPQNYTTASISQDDKLKMVWLGKPQAGIVSLKSYSSSNFESGDSSGMEYPLAEFFAARTDTTNLGRLVENLGDGHAVAAADSAYGGQIYILEYRNSTQKTTQILSNLTSGTTFAKSISCSSDGTWLAIGSPANTGGSVLLYKKYVAASANNSLTGNGSNTYTLSFAPQGGHYGLRVVDNNQHILIPVVDYTVVGTTIAFTASVSIGNVYTYSQLETYYHLEQVCTSTEAAFGTSVSLSTDGTSMVVGCPRSTGGEIFIYSRDVRYTLVSNQRVITDSNTWNLVFSKAAGDSSPDYGCSVSLNGNWIAVGSPASSIVLDNQTIYQHGAVEILVLDTETNQQSSVPVPSLSDVICVNNWLVPAASSKNDLVTKINSLTNVSGISVALDQTGNNLLINSIAAKHINGFINRSNQTGSSKWIVFNTLTHEDHLSTALGTKVRWISPSLLGILETYTEYAETERFDFDLTTIFDSGSTVIYDGQPTVGQRLSLYQLLRTSRDYLAGNADSAQLSKVKTLQYQDVIDGTDISFSGNAIRIWIANSMSTDESKNVTVYSNPTGVPGWYINRRQQTPVDTGCIKRAWIYNSRTKTKVADLDSVDLSQGLFPGQIAQYLNYITGIDPAIYGIAIWQSGVYYNLGDRVKYNGKVYSALVNNTGVIFDASRWLELPAQSSASNSGSQRWGRNQVGQTWFSTRRMRVIDPSGSTHDILNNANNWFPTMPVVVFEWVASNTNPAGYSGNGIVNPDTPYVYDAVENTWYFWVANSTTVGKVHPVSSAVVAQSLQNIGNSGNPMITAAASNAVILYNVKDLVDNGENILHIDYASSDHNNRIHNEYQLLSEGTNGRWKNTPIYAKMVDSLSGINSNGIEVPDSSIPMEDRIGVSMRPRQTMFRNYTQALKIYFEVVNSMLAKRTIANATTLRSIEEKQPTPAYDYAVPDRQTLLLLDKNQYAGINVLVYSDNLVANKGWSLNKLDDLNTTWQLIARQNYDLSAFWAYQDWYSDDYSPRQVETTIPHIGYLNSVTLIPGDYLYVTNNGNDAITYQIQDDLSLVPVRIQNSTIQFLPSLYDIEATNYGFDDTVFDYASGFDAIPNLSIRMIIEALNNYILVGDLSDIAEKAFFAMLRYILQENPGVDWLFRTSFITVNHRVKDLNIKTNFRQDDEQFVKDFVNESKPYHTRLREYVNSYIANDTAGIKVTDFDLPAFWQDYAMNANKWPLRSPQAVTADDNNDVISELDAAVFQQPEYIDWFNNHKYTLTGIDIVDSGRNYVSEPTIIITDSTGTVATAIATVNSDTGTLHSIYLDTVDKTFINEPNILVSGGFGIASWNNSASYDLGKIVEYNGNYWLATTANTGVTPGISAVWQELYDSDSRVPRAAKLVPVFENDNTRKVKTSLIFDRIGVTPAIYNSNNTYESSEIVLYQGNFYTAIRNVPAGSVPTLTQFWRESIDDEKINSGAPIRNTAFYTPVTGLAALDPRQLYAGASYTGVNVHDLEFTSNNLITQSISSEFSDSTLGQRALDIVVNGSDFYNNIQTPSTEELIKGRIQDVLSIRVYSDNTRGTPTSYHMTQDNLGNRSFYVIAAAKTSLIRRPLGPDDTEIFVDDINALLEEGNTNGAIYIGAERIEFDDADLINMKLLKLKRGTRGTSVYEIHHEASLAEAVNSAQKFPGTAAAFGRVVVSIAPANNSFIIKVNDASNLKLGMPVKGAGINGSPVITAFDIITGTITVDVLQTIPIGTTLSVGDVSAEVVYPETTVNVNSYEGYKNTWYTAGIGTAADGNGLQRSSTPVALFLLANPGVQI